MSFTKSKYSLDSQTSPREAIGYFQPAIEEALSTHGWLIEERRRYVNDPWFIELWVLQSQWSSADRQLFLVFETNDLLYSIALALEEPTDHHTTEWQARLYLKRGWQQELPEFLDAINTIRDRSNK